MGPPKVLVGAPISDNHAYCINEYLKGLMNIAYPNYDILLVDNSQTDKFYKEMKEAGFKDVIRAGYNQEHIRERMVTCRNILRDKVLNEDYDYFLNIDQDVIPPKDIIQGFLAHKKPILTGIYFNHSYQDDKFFPTIWRNWTEEEIKKTKENLHKIKDKNPDLIKLLEKHNYNFSKLRMPITMNEIGKNQLMKIRECGSGCLLISKEVLEKIEFRYESGQSGFDDVWFCHDATNIGYSIYADTNIKCKHLIKDRPWTWKFVDDEMYMYKRKN